MWLFSVIVLKTNCSQKIFIMETLNTDDLSQLASEILSIENTLIQEKEMGAKIFSSNLKLINKDKLSMVALLLLDLEVEGLPGITAVEDLAYFSLNSLHTPTCKHYIKEETLSVPIGHLLRVTPISDIKDGINEINAKTDFEIVDTLGMLPRPRKNVNGKEYLNPDLKSFKIRGCFKIDKYIRGQNK